MKRILCRIFGHVWEDCTVHMLHLDVVGQTCIVCGKWREFDAVPVPTLPDPGRKGERLS